MDLRSYIAIQQGRSRTRELASTYPRLAKRMAWFYERYKRCVLMWYQVSTFMRLYALC